MIQTIIGKKAVYEALRSGQKIERIVIDFRSKADQEILRIQHLAKQIGIKIQLLSPQVFAQQADEKYAQGVIAFLSSFKEGSLDNLIANPEAYPFVLAVDHIEDPYNFGAMIRTCEIFNVKAVIYPKDRNCQITPGVVKASSGAINYVDLVKVTNLAQSIEKLRKNGYWIYGASSVNGEDLPKIKPNFPLVLIVGNEHKGLSALMQKQLDVSVKIPMFGQIDSLNVSVSAGIIMYEFMGRK